MTPLAAGDAWSAIAPISLEPRTYLLRWQCGNDPKKALQLGVVEVLPRVPRVLWAGNLSAEDPGKIALKEPLSILVDGLRAWRGKSKENKDAPLHLYMDSIELKNLTVSSLTFQSEDTDRALLSVVLEVDNAEPTRKAWVQLLQSAKSKQTIPVSIGPAGSAFPTLAWITFDVLPWYLWAVIGMLVILVGVLIFLGKTSTLLRDATGAGADAPYSLAKHQMAIWFVVVVGAYLYLSMITGTAATASSTALILIGISGATGLAAVTIDNSKRGLVGTTRVALEAERDAIVPLLDDPASGLKAQLARAAAGSTEAIQLAATIQVKLGRLNELSSQLAQPVAIAATSRGWYLDLLSDENGISFHRLQMATWTIVLAGIFVRSAFVDLVMPEFDATTLGLMGISSSTYIGFKLPEQKS